MNLYKQFVKETNQKANYVKWLETKIKGETPEPEINVIKSNTSFLSEDGIKIDYENPDLGYNVEVCFPRLLSGDEQEQVENIIAYWSAIPYVSVEGNYGMQWGMTHKGHKIIVDIDFTKSASDDIGGREVLEKLGNWIWQGTPKKRNGSQTIEGVIRPDSVTAGSM